MQHKLHSAGYAWIDKIALESNCKEVEKYNEAIEYHGNNYWQISSNQMSWGRNHGWLLPKFETKQCINYAD